MTVEQSPLERFTNQKQPPLLNAEKETSQSPTAGVIDLTNDSTEKEDDLTKAIALSLKEHEKVFGGQVSMEDQDISRVVEASLAESKAVGTKRKRGEAWQDPLNPHDRKRNGDWPVGLKNVGNTCWFSAVIQSLFHLPIFRRLVLGYLPPRDWNSIQNETKERRNLLFMQELRKLFALMLCTKRKYVDPSQSLEELKEAFPDSSGTDTQQDVSEFSHKLLEWLEEAFKLNSYSHHEDSLMESTEHHRNPMLDLFYGHFRSEGLNEGRMFSNEETFGQYPLQVNSFNNIHESLEAAMAQEIESYDVMTKSGQESWFTKLPPVLLFELSRFQFNQQLGRPEKIHNKLEFPEIMFMDRYMESNKNITRSLREKVHRLKDEREKLEKNLERYLNYGSGPKKVPLNDVLQYSLEFVESKKNGGERSPVSFCTDDIDMDSPASVSSMGGDSPCNSPNKPNAMDLVSTPSGTFVLHTSFDQNTDSNEDAPIPMPQHVSEVELKVLQTCFKRWSKEVDNNIKALQEAINSIDNIIRNVYNDPSLKKKPYRLHAVLVHEGQAASGHYWAYVYCPNRSMWLKYNDISVTDATWGELQKECMGGHHYASAYCLMYVDAKREELFEETREIEMVGPDCLSGLPEELQQYITEDNSNFQMEIEQWDFEQTRKKDFSTMASEDIDCAIIAEKRITFDDTINPSLFHDRLCVEHATLLCKSTIARVEQVSKMIASQGPLEAFEEIVRQESSRLRRLIRLPTTPCDDARLQHIGAYILMNSNTSEPFLTWSILEQFLIPELDEFPQGQLIKEASIKKLNTLKRSLKDDHFRNYILWHQEYQKFRNVVTYFVAGIENYHLERFVEALNLLMYCCRMNSALMRTPQSKRGLDPKLVFHYRRQSALKLNEVTARQFELLDPKGASEALLTAHENVLPSMEFLNSKTATVSDTEVAEAIRNRWCSMLGFDIASEQSPKRERLQDFLSKLLDPTIDLPKTRAISQIRWAAGLEDRFRCALSTSIKTGEYEAAELAK